LFTTVITAIASSNFTELRTPRLFPVYFDQRRPLATPGPTTENFVTPYVCLPSDLYSLFIDILYLSPFESNVFIPRA